MADPSVPATERLRALARKFQEEAHWNAVRANALFSVEHWKHNAGVDWPHEPDDDSWIAFENCQHPLCVLVRSLEETPEPREAEPVTLKAPCKRWNWWIGAVLVGGERCNSCGFLRSEHAPEPKRTRRIAALSTPEAK